MPVIIIAASQSFSRPADWNDANNSIECIGGGAGGWAGYGGGGGAYAKSVNLAIAASTFITIGAGGSPNSAGLDTSFGSSVIAKAGQLITGGPAGSCTYNSIAYSGGDGGAPSLGGGGPGGSSIGGGGGGGAGGRFGGGFNGSPGSGEVGGTGGNSQTAIGGGGGFNAAGSPGGTGTDFGSPYGAGGGGGGGGGYAYGAGFNGGDGGWYGSGGGGPGSNSTFGSGTPGYGRSGIVVITYTAAVPTVGSASPSAGTRAGGTFVTITGTNFGGATSVTFGGTAATGVTVVNSTTITCTAPAHVPGLVSVAVSGPGGTGSANVYRYGDEPLPARRDIALSSIAPTLDIALTVWYPPTKDLALSSEPPVVAIVPLSPTFNPSFRDILLSTTAPSVANTAKRNIEVGQANLFVDRGQFLWVRTVRNPAFDLGANLSLSTYAPTLKATTEATPIDIIEDDLENIITIIENE